MAATLPPRRRWVDGPGGIDEDGAMALQSDYDLAVGEEAAQLKAFLAAPLEDWADAVFDAEDGPGRDRAGGGDLPPGRPPRQTAGALASRDPRFKHDRGRRRPRDPRSNTIEGGSSSRTPPARRGGEDQESGTGPRRPRRGRSSPRKGKIKLGDGSRAYGRGRSSPRKGDIKLGDGSRAYGRGRSSPRRARLGPRSRRSSPRRRPAPTGGEDQARGRGDQARAGVDRARGGVPHPREGKIKNKEDRRGSAAWEGRSRKKEGDPASGGRRSAEGRVRWAQGTVRWRDARNAPRNRTAHWTKCARNRARVSFAPDAKALRAPFQKVIACQSPISPTSPSSSPTPRRR